MKKKLIISNKNTIKYNKSYKQKLFELLETNKYFFIAYIFFLIAGSLLLLIPKQELLLALNGINNSYYDIFFKYYTNLGDGIIYLIFVFVLIFTINLRWGIIGFLSFISSGLVAQILKKFFDTPRPKTFFSGSGIIHYVDGVDILSFQSFPSGHTATAFSMFLLLSILSKNNILKLLFFVCALFVGISRMYLLQHFYIDVYFGSIIGIITTIIIYLIFKDYKISETNSRLNKSLIKIFTTKK